ncbi:ShlB/FhaC/HecB family hemolysin secretion/activation protein [Calothrix sp. FACHB-156]|nr:ShlB/FhaC/HecB family hemolysin secretion/activation protein [Calothrix sp. FACHB-156]
MLISQAVPEVPTLGQTLVPLQTKSKASLRPTPTPPEIDVDVAFRNNLLKESEVVSSQVFNLKTMTVDSFNAKSIDIAQVSLPGNSFPQLPQEPREDRQVPSTPSPVPESLPLQSPKSPAPESRPKQEPLCPETSPTEESGNTKIPEQITVEKFEFKGNKAFTQKDLEKLTNEYLNKRLSLERLVCVASLIAKHYHDKDYKTSGAIVFIPKETQRDGKGLVIIQVIEGTLKEIRVTTLSEKSDSQGNVLQNSRLENYVRSRLLQAASKPLNINKLQEALQLLQFDSVIGSVTARLSAGTEAGESILDVQVEEEKSLSTTTSFDNGRVPSVGSFQQRAGLIKGNLLAIGDSLSLGYAKTGGSNAWDANYTLPINPNNGTLRFAYGGSNNKVIESPFDDIDKDGKGGDIESTSNSYELTLRQPIIRRIQNFNTNESVRRSTYREFALGLTTSLRESKTSLLDIPFPLSPGADNDGFSRVFALRFFQDWTQQNAQEVIALRSQFNFGLNAFDSTINEPIPGLNEVVPDSRFFSWQGQALWLRVLDEDQFLRLRANVQLADRALMSSEQFVIGGLGSVRGYRQDALQTDNGVFVTAEVEIPVARVFRNAGVIKVIPFVDYGIGWNSSGQENPSPNSLASLGVGLQWRQGNNFNVRLDWGIPLISVVFGDSRTWQENGLYFSVQWNPL